MERRDGSARHRPGCVERAAVGGAEGAAGGGARPVRRKLPAAAGGGQPLPCVRPRRREPRQRDSRCVGPRPPPKLLVHGSGPTRVRWVCVLCGWRARWLLHCRRPLRARTCVTPPSHSVVIPPRGRVCEPRGSSRVGVCGRSRECGYARCAYGQMCSMRLTATSHCSLTPSAPCWRLPRPGRAALPRVTAARRVQTDRRKWAQYTRRARGGRATTRGLLLPCTEAPARLTARTAADTVCVTAATEPPLHTRLALGRCAGSTVGSARAMGTAARQG